MKISDSASINIQVVPVLDKMNIKLKLTDSDKTYVEFVTVLLNHWDPLFPPNIFIIKVRQNNCLCFFSLVPASDGKLLSARILWEKNYIRRYLFLIAVVTLSYSVTHQAKKPNKLDNMCMKSRKYNLNFSRCFL